MAVKTGGPAIDYGPYAGNVQGGTFGRWLPQRKAIGQEDFSPDQLAAQRQGELEAKEKMQTERQAMQREEQMRAKQYELQKRQLALQEEQAGKGGK
jgi:predicted GIY-YIG superfamily endonuclease